MNKELIIDFINYDVIAIFFLLIPFNIIAFLNLVVMLIFDLISLYIIERKELKDTFELVDDYRYDHWEG